MLLLLLACAEPETGRGPVEDVLALTGEATWRADFDADAEAAGLADCDYTRTYDGWEDRSLPWLCPDCDPIVRLQTALTGDRCYDRVSATPPEPVEWHGPAGESWYRGAENWALSDQGALTVDGDTWTWTNATDPIAIPEGTVTFTVDGRFDVRERREDPWHGARPPDDDYVCGWPRTDRPDWDGPWRVREGRTLPDGWFRDVCHEFVRLHDFAGTWLIIDISAIDCPPCRDLAEGEAAFIEQMASEGIPLEVVTLLVPSLGDPLGHTTAPMQLAWTETYDLHSPVLADRGWGAWVLGDALGEDFAYPAWIVVDPDLTVVAYGTGYGGWDYFRQFIQP